MVAGDYASKTQVNDKGRLLSKKQVNDKEKSGIQSTGE